MAEISKFDNKLKHEVKLKNWFKINGACRTLDSSKRRGVWGDMGKHNEATRLT